jgi:aryl-alcohol dehydrogenase-like predicted oxidoreductase
MAKMKYGRIEGLDKDISRLAQGCMVLSSDKMEWSLDLLDGVHGLGCNCFDSAHIYGGGKCDLALGEWLSRRGVRDKVVILEKGCHPKGGQKRVTPQDLAEDLETCLERLRTDYVDIYLLHRDDPAVEVGPIVEALNEQHEKGRIKLFGGSNWRHERVAEANAYAHTHGLRPFTVCSPNFSLAEMVQSPWGDDCISISGPHNADARRWYTEQGMPLFTWSSLARGFFSGLISRDNLDALKGSDESSVRAYCHEVNFKRLDRATELARRKGVKIPQIALAYVVNQPGLDIYALIGCRSVGEFQEGLEAAELRLSPEELAWLDLRD